MPALFHLADKAATRAQRSFVGWVVGTGVASVLAALSTAYDAPLVSGVRIGSLAAALFFALQLLLLGGAWVRRPDRSWYDARAGAESVKTMIWRFGVGGEPFPIHLSSEAAEQVLAERASRVFEELHATLPRSEAREFLPLPGPLLELRRSVLKERRVAYLQGRLEGQRSWYRQKARHHERRVALGMLAMALIGAAGVVGGLLRAIDSLGFDFDAAGVCGALVGAVLGLQQARQHSVLSRAYTVTADEIELLMAHAPSVSESDWARFVDSAEEALSREHTMWLATHGRAREEGSVRLA